MNANSPIWRIGLYQPPVIVSMGVAQHGHAPVELYRLPRLWCVHLYRYQGLLRIENHELAIRPGHASLTPPGARLEYHFQGPSRHVYAHFRLPHGGPTVSAPAMQPLGERFDRLYAAMEQAVGFGSTQRRRADVRLWDVLWELADAPEAGAVASKSDHGAVERVRQLIELRLDQPIRIAALATEAGVSHNHLIRLFRAATGTTIQGYIRRRRAERARHLLTRSTLPIKAIAVQVGIPDLHLFNKTIRRELGSSPRQVRG